MFSNFFPIVDTYVLVAKTWPDKVVRWCRDGDFRVLYFSEPRAAHVRHAF